MTKIKALSVLDFQEGITQEFGLESHEKIKAAMRKEDRDIVYAADVTPISWLDLGAVINHLMVFDQLFSTDDKKASDTVLRKIANKHFIGIYRRVLKFDRPEEVVKKTAALWNRFYDSGQAVVESFDGNGLTLKIINCRDLPMHHELCFVPYIEEVLSLILSRNVVVKQTQCVATGAEHCIFKYRW